MHFTTRTQRLSLFAVGLATTTLLFATLAVVFPSPARANPQGKLASGEIGTPWNSEVIPISKAESGVGLVIGGVRGLDANQNGEECSDGFEIFESTIPKWTKLHWECGNPSDMRGIKMLRGIQGDDERPFGMSGHWDADYTGPIPQYFKVWDAVGEENYWFQIMLLDKDGNVIATSAILLVSGTKPPSVQQPETTPSTSPEPAPKPTSPPTPAPTSTRIPVRTPAPRSIWIPDPAPAPTSTPILTPHRHRHPHRH